MTAKRRQLKFGVSERESLLQQCKQLPGRLRNVCVDAAKQRYERHYHPSNPYRRRHVVVDMLLALGLVLSLAAVAFISLVYQRTVQRDRIEVTALFEKPSAASGDLVEFTLDIRNNGWQDMTDVALHFPTSTGFRVEYTVPAMGADGLLRLPDVEGHDDGRVIVGGVAIGEVGSAARVNAALQYRFNGVGPLEEQVVSEAIFIAGSRLSLSVQTPESLVLYHPFPFEITVKNDGSRAFSNLALVVSFPPGWHTIISNTETDPATGQWLIDQLDGGAWQTITGRAELLEPVGEAAVISARVYAAPQGTPFLQAEQTLTVPVYSPNIAVRLKSAPSFVRLGERAEFGVEVTNNEKTDLTNARIHLYAPFALVDITAYPSGDWNDDVLSLPLGTIPVGQAVSQTLSVVMRPTVNPSEVFGAGDVGYVWRAELHYDGANGELFTVPFDERLIPIESDLSLSIIGRYASSEGETVGTGPWPPKAGERTTLWLFFQVDNHLNTLSNAVLTAQLPEGVRATGRQSVTAGEAVSVDATGRLVWRIGALENYKSIDAKAVSAALEVELIPENDDFDTYSVTLLHDASVTARDTAAQTQLSVQAPPLSSSQVFAK